MVVQPTSRFQITGEKRASLLKLWPRDEVVLDSAQPMTRPPHRSRSEPHGRPRSAFETIFAACEALQDPTFHDGWQPVRARTASEPTDEEITRS